MDAAILRNAQIIWDYHLMNHALKKCDGMLVLGSHDKRVASYAARLFLDGWVSWILFSGGFGKYTKYEWDRPEAHIFADIARDLWVPEKKILIEEESTNTGENIRFSKELLAKKKLNPTTLLLVQKPYMERRSYATIKKLWPEIGVTVTSPRIAFSDYPDEENTFERVLNAMVWDLQRIREYPEKGFQIAQEIPQEVWSAYQELVQVGYNKHLVA